MTKPEGPAQEPQRVTGCTVSRDDETGLMLAKLHAVCVAGRTEEDAVSSLRLVVQEIAKQQFIAIPATPAPSQQPCKRCSGTGVVRPAADNCPRCDGNGIEPTPSQRAAREAEAFVTKFARERHVKFPETWDFIYELLDAFLAQQTAELRAQRSLESRAYAESIDRHNARAELAERERDSLREFLESEIHNDKCDCLKCIRIRKAVKAGKDEQK